MIITSDAIKLDGSIISQYTCDGSGLSPSLTFSEVPVAAKSLVVIMEDPDSPEGLFTHWLIYDMSPATLQIVEGKEPLTGKQGINDFAAKGYGGPCPHTGTHHYYFRLFALGIMLGLPEGISSKELKQAMYDNIIESAELVGTYKKQNSM